jgi:hypothetical protein
MKLRFTIDDENPGSLFHCYQQFSWLFSEQACDTCNFDRQIINKVEECEGERVRSRRELRHR